MRKLIHGIIVLIHILFSQSISAQKMMREVELGNRYYFCNEPAIAINPSDKRFEVVATNKAHVFYSKNHGKRFRHQRAKSSLGVYGDPVVLYNKKNICFYVHLSQDKSKEWGESFDQIVVQKSGNNGKTWNDGTGIGKNGKMHDKAWISIDENEQSKFSGNVYVSWTQFDKYESKAPGDSSRILFAHSNNDGNSFSAPLIVSDIAGDCADGDSTMEGATTCTGPKGEVYIAWAGFEKIFFDKSMDGGKNFGQDKVAMNCNKGWDLNVPGFYRTNGLPFLNSNQEGTLFLCTAFEEKGFNKVFVSSSIDGGFTWSAPDRIMNADSTHYFMPHAYLDKSTGNYFILYYSLKNSRVDVMLSYKLNKSNEYKHIKINQSTFMAPGKSLFMGDYINVCAVGNTVACVWTEPKGLASVVKTRKLLLY